MTNPNDIVQGKHLDSLAAAFSDAISNIGGVSSPAVVSYQEATTVQSGLMSAQDKIKLDSLASITTAGANITIENGTISAANTTYSAGSNITINGTTISGTPNTTYSAASTTTAGLMSAADKQKLNNLASITAAGDNITITGGTIKAAGGGNYSEATSLEAGLMSASDKQHLDSLFQLSSDFVDTVLAGIGSKFFPTASTVSDFISHSDYNIQFFDSKLQKIFDGTDYTANATKKPITMQGGQCTLSFSISGTKNSLTSSAGSYVTLASDSSTLEHYYQFVKLSESGGVIIDNPSIVNSSGESRDGEIAIYPFRVSSAGAPTLGSKTSIQSATSTMGYFSPCEYIHSIFDPNHILFFNYKDTSGTDASNNYLTISFNAQTNTCARVATLTAVGNNSTFSLITCAHRMPTVSENGGVIAVSNRRQQSLPLLYYKKSSNSEAKVIVHHGISKQAPTTITLVNSSGTVVNPWFEDDNNLIAGIWRTKNGSTCYVITFKTGTYTPSPTWFDTAATVWTFDFLTPRIIKTNYKLSDVIDDLLL